MVERAAGEQVAGEPVGEGASEVTPSHVRVLVVNGHGSLLLAKRRDPASGKCVWEPPGGAIDPGESWRAAAEREVREETGLVVDLSVRRWLPVHREYAWKDEDRVRDEVMCTASVDDPEVRPQMPTEEERATFLEWRWVGEEELPLLDAPIYPGDPFTLARHLGLHPGGPAPGPPLR